jgi:3,4-dihydroxy-2-butanone 4-phosphate synthase
MNDDGTMPRVEQLHEFAKHNLKMITVADLIKFGCRRALSKRG